MGFSIMALAIKSFYCKPSFKNGQSQIQPYIYKLSILNNESQHTKNTCRSNYKIQTFNN